MDLQECIDNAKDSFELLISEVEYYEKRVNSKKVTRDDMNYVVADIKDCRKKLNDIMRKITSIAIIKED